jgi:hypothetical protein
MTKPNGSQMVAKVTRQRLVRWEGDIPRNPVVPYEDDPMCVEIIEIDEAGETHLIYKRPE